MKLKTLKDFKGSLDFSLNVVSIIALRQEAIKEIKQFRKEVEKAELGIDKSFINGKINYIIEKFNITEEDLEKKQKL